MCAHIVFAANDHRSGIEVRKPSEVMIDTSIDNACQSATITLPRNISALQQQQLKDLIKRGDAVSISLGYDGELNEEFTGYVESVGADVPVVIKVRDALWKVLQVAFNKSYQAAHLPTVLMDLFGTDYSYQVMDATIGPIRFEKTTKGGAVKALKDDFGLVTFLKGTTIFCGKLFDSNARTVTYDQERNMKSSDLVYRVSDDVKMKLSAKSIQKDGSDDIKVDVGDEDGEQRTVVYYGIDSKEELKKLADADLQRFKYDGYEGSFKGWGVPWCQFGDKVQLKSTLYPDRDGDYLAESVKVTFGKGGYEREIKLAQSWTP